MHKRIAVVKEKWLLFGDWYIHPSFNKERKNPYWKSDNKIWHLPNSIAHKCQDGSIQGLIGPGVHKSKKTGLIKIYGKCRKCGASVGKEIHTIVNMTMIL